MTSLAPIESSSEPICPWSASVKYLGFLHRMIAAFGSLPPLAFGLPGNVLIILIANRKHNRHLSPSIYMTAMAVVDSITLLLSGVYFSLFYGSEVIPEADRGPTFL